MTTAERDVLNATNGMIIFNTETKTLDIFDGTFWRNIYPNSRASNCDDYIDNDGDGLTDCDDPDCDLCCARVIWYTAEEEDICVLVNRRAKNL